MSIEVLSRISRGEYLDIDTTSRIVEEIARDSMTEAQLGAILMGLRLRGETPEEIAGFRKGIEKDGYKGTK